MDDKKPEAATTGEELKTEVWDAAQSLDSLIDLALPKWWERIGKKIISNPTYSLLKNISNTTQK